MLELSKLLSHLPNDATEAVLGMARLETPAINRELRKAFTGEGRADEKLLAEPHIEGAFPWLPHPGGWGDLVGSLLHPKTVEIQRQVSFPPYAHQVAAWEKLCGPETASVIVSSGTGSGKTECFLVPVLDRLVRLSEASGGVLTGVRALMLYPLNALISSQEERLAKWFSPFKGKLRYCLYNGETPNEARFEDSRQTPWKVQDRKTLRQSPPPVLVTNVTMLEYMLIRQLDEPILRQSAGTLDFIVLDEAHSYVGAQAAEIALLLRRVTQAFGKRPDELRYVATSATIGTGDARELHAFLQDLSGAPGDRIHVVTGARAPLPPPSPQVRLGSLPEMQGLAPEEAGTRLAGNPTLRKLRESLRAGAFVSWSEWRDCAGSVLGEKVDDERASVLLARAASARDPNADPAMRKAGADFVLPVRVHLFERPVIGVFTCVNPLCSGKPRPRKEDEAPWPHGAIFSDVRERCPHCRSMVLEWVYCTSCGDGALRAQYHEGDEHPHVSMWESPADEDGLIQTFDPDDASDTSEFDDEPDRPKMADGLVYLLPPETSLPRLSFRCDTGEETGREAPGAVSLSVVRDVRDCPKCGFEPKKIDPRRGALRPLSAGPAFLMSQIVPGLLESLSAAPRGEDLPFSGRQLITFTDARQGTARHAAGLQIASERAFTRGFVYHFVQDQPKADPEAIARLETEIEALGENPILRNMLAERQQALEVLRGQTDFAKPWSSLVQKFAGERTVRVFSKAIWEPRDTKFSDDNTLAEFLLYREMMRRPVRSNSAETLGLFRFELPGERDPSISVPSAAAHLGLTREDWLDLLRLLLTHFLRTNVILHFDRDWLTWIDRRQSHPQVVPWSPNVETSRYVRSWPTAYGNRPTRIVGLLRQALNISESDKVGCDAVSRLLSEAWTVFHRYMEPASEGFRFRLGELLVAPVRKAFWCPVTKRVLDTTFRGLSPYHKDKTYQPAEPIHLPKLPFAWRRDAEGRHVDDEVVAAWLKEDSVVRTLRERGMWGDQQDRAVKLMPWLRAAEHSAQQPASLLREYEAEFKEHRINVLGCSTTMEMGVDIGSVEAVLMTNAPPAIANYRQRVGRAGRRGQPIAVGLTLCKSRPLDRLAVADPGAFLRRTVPAPRVSLDSTTIVRRHVNALLLSRFMKDWGSELHRLTIGSFFGLGEGATDRIDDMTPAQAFLRWSNERVDEENLRRSLQALLVGTPLRANADLFETAREQFLDIQRGIEAEWKNLADDPVLADDPEVQAANRARKAERKRLETGYLLGELAGRGFLPSYGFPTGVVPFVNMTPQELAKAKDEEENRFSTRGFPSRERDVAIFEYAPGRGIVIDGIVKESAGITLNWKRPASEEGVREVQSLREIRSCKRCGTLWAGAAADSQRRCPECHAEEPLHMTFIAPAGFAVDARAKAHDDTADLGESQLLVDPWVSARGGLWRSLPHPESGRFRTSPNGLVFWFNPGPHNKGFAVCLHCGRAAAEMTSHGPSPLAGHQPLRGYPRVADSKLCTGALDSNPFAVQRHLRLGHEIRTDVTEMQIYDCPSRETALTVALALREAVAAKLGIDADEMGFAAPASPTADGRKVFSAVIFDRASGGAGFSAELARDPVGILRAAVEFLDCSRPGRCGDPEAARACPRCILAADSQHVAEETNRQQAQRLLTELVSRLVLPDEFKVFGHSTVYEGRPLGAALLDAMDQDPSAVLHLRLCGNPEDWDLDELSVASALERLGGRGRNITLAVPLRHLEAADAVTRRTVVLWAERMRARLVDGGDEDTPLLARVDSTRGSVAWGNAGSNARAVGPGWGDSSSAPLVHGVVASSSAPLRPIAGPVLLQEAQREAVVEIRQELDGPLADFGDRLKRLVTSKSQEFANILAGDATEVVYRDRYLVTPIAAALAARVVKAFSSAGSAVSVETRDARDRYNDGGRGYKISHNWRDLADRDRVLDGLIKTFAPQGGMAVVPTLPHRRELLVKTTRGTLSVFFDQGVGAWTVRGHDKYDFSRPVEEQLRALRESWHVIVAEPPTFLAVQAR